MQLPSLCPGSRCLKLRTNLEATCQHDIARYALLASADGYFEAHWSSQWSVNAVWEVRTITR